MRALSYSLRSLARDLSFTSTALLSLALGLGATTAIFSIVDAVLLRPLAYRDPGRLYDIREIVPKVAATYPQLPVNAFHFTTWRGRCASFESMALLRDMRANLTGLGEPEELTGIRASANLFRLLGVAPRYGRDFTTGDDQPGRERVLVLTHSFWVRRFHADPSTIGRKILLGGEPHIIIGILPSSFRFPVKDQLGAVALFPARIDFFRPIAIGKDDLNPEGNFNFAVLARLRPGVDPRHALAELNIIEADLARALPGNWDFRAAMVPLQDGMVGRVRQGLLILLAAVGAVLLIVCVNLANLSLARAAAHAREAAIRVALGAGRGRLVRQALAESLLLALAGGALGLAFARWALALLVRSAPIDLPRLDEVRLDATALAFAFLLSLAAGVLFGILPALRAARQDPQETLKSGSHTVSETRAGLRLRSLLVAAEVGLSAVLLIVSGLLMSSLVRLLHVDKGLTQTRVLTVQLGLPATRYQKDADRTRFTDELLRRVQALPGVRSAAVTNALPLQGETWITILTLPGDHRPLFERPMSNLRFVSPDYFSTLGIPVLQGRPFEPRDRGRRVLIVSEQVARKLWPGQNPLGKLVKENGGDDEPPAQVIGVVGDVRATLQKAPPPVTYDPYWQRSPNRNWLVVRTAMDPRAAASAVRSAIWQVDSDIPVPEMQTLQELIVASVGQRRFQMLLTALFAASALLLASLGIYGVLATSVARRTGEIGIRMALGARPGDLLGMLVRQGLKPVAAGLAAGLLGALALGRLLRALLFDVSPADPLTISAVAVILFAVGLAACVLPALRATRIQPTRALRYD